MKKTITFLLITMLLLSTLFPASAMAAENDKTVVRVGWYPYPACFEMHNGEYSGYIYDYLMEIAKYTDWEYEFVKSDYVSCTEMLAKGEVDLVGGLQKNSEREAFFDYPELSYGESYSVLFTKKDSSLQPNDYKNYNGITVGVMENTVNDKYFADFAKENGFTYKLSYFASSDELNAALQKEDVDAAVLSSVVATNKTRILAKFAPNPLYFVTTKGNYEVLDGLNMALNGIKTNRPYFSSELYQKYYADKVDMELTSAERKIVQDSKKTPVRIGAVDNSAPLCSWNEDTGAFEGINVEMLEAAAKKIGLNYTLVPVDITRREKATTPTKDSPMLVLGVTKTEAIPDTRGWNLSSSLLTDSLGVVGLQGQNLSTKKGAKTVAVMEGFGLTSEYAKLYMPDFKIVEYTTLQDCMDAVADGKVDAAIYMYSCIRYLLQKPYYEKLELISTYSDDVDICVAGFTEESQDYVNIITKGLQGVTESDRQEIVLNCTMGNPYKPTLQDTLYKYRIPLIVIVCLALFIIALLAALYIFRRKSNKQIQEALIVAEQAGAAKGNFMSRMSHEIRTPLNAVIGYNTIARNELTEAKTEAERRQSEMKVMDCLTKSDIASRHLLTIINDVLDISAIESGKITVVNDRFDFKGLISSLTAVFYSQAKSKGIDFEVQFKTQMDEWIVGDQMRINQILTNLLSNAVKFTPDGGKVMLIIDPQTDNDYINVNFEVIDTGIGMSEEHLEHIWTPFEQADSSISRRFGGTGLGLSITQTLVDLLGGSISVKSRVGEGSTFSVDLSFARTEQPEDQGLYDFSTIKALIVDDDVSTCDYIRLLLTRSGVRNAAVYSGEEAINAVKASFDENEPYTFCLVDWRMPKMDGLETVRQIRSIAGDSLPIIVITAYDFTEIAEKAAEVGVNRFISKPLFQSSLFNLLANISGGPVPRDTEKISSFDFSNAKVLLAEDNTMNMEIACKLLESAKLSVDQAWNGQEAVDRFLAAPSGTYKAILMDVQMPVLDGYQATKAIRASAHEDATSIPIIAMTADAFSENVAESLSIGMNDHISKPIDLTTLFSTLNKYID